MHSENYPGSIMNRISQDVFHSPAGFVMIVLCVCLQCLSVPDRLPGDRFHIPEADRRGYLTSVSRAVFQEDGKVLVCGVISLRGRNYIPERFLSVMRFNRDGSLDSGFALDRMFRSMDISHPLFFDTGSDGKIYVVIILYEDDNPICRGFQLSPEGKVLSSRLIKFRRIGLTKINSVVFISGGCYLAGVFNYSDYSDINNPVNIKYTLLKYDTQGNPQEGFTPPLYSITGEITTGVSAVDGKGRIVLWRGEHTLARGERVRFFRILSDGSIDPAFGENFRKSGYRDKIMYVHDAEVSGEGGIAAVMKVYEGKKFRDVAMWFDDNGNLIRNTSVKDYRGDEHIVRRRQSLQTHGRIRYYNCTLLLESRSGRGFSRKLGSCGDFKYKKTRMEKWGDECGSCLFPHGILRM